MATKRQKKTVLTEVSDSMANSAFATYAQAQSQVKRIQADMELQISRIREKYADKLQTLQQASDDAFDVLQTYATLHPELFAKKKSLDMAHGTIGFRTGTPKLKPLKGFTWASIAQLAKKFLPANYIRVTSELAKDKLLADRDLDSVALSDSPTGVLREVPMREALGACGIKVVQEESFFVEPKTEEDV